MMKACLFKYNMDVGLLVRYLSNNYTGAYHDVEVNAKIMTLYNIDYGLIQHCIRVMTVGCINYFIAELSHANVIQYQREGNN